MTIVHVVASLEARHGGPSRSVRRLAAATASLGHRVEILTSAPTALPETNEGNLRIRTFRRGWPEAVCPIPGLAAALAAAEADVVHAHGIWLRPLHDAHRHARRAGIPLLISPRGMMASWSWQHRRWRKVLADRLVHPGALRGATAWHATSTEESDEIRALGFSQPVCVSPNGVDVPGGAELESARAYWHPRLADAAGRRVALFHSRFHRKKRPLELIRLWAELAPVDWELLLVGVPDDYSVADLVAETRRVGARNVRIFDGTQSPPPYAAASVFLLPSHNENFGLVVAEALAHGVPVLVTDTLPWKAVATRSAGWCTGWSEFPGVLSAVLRTSPGELIARGASGRAWMQADFSWESSARSLADFYRSLAA